MGSMGKRGKMQRKFVKGTWQLCFVQGTALFFTDDISKISKDGWDDCPCDCNASIYYQPENMRIFGFIEAGGYIENNMYRCSANDLNNGRMPWLYEKDAGGLYGGATIEEAMEWIRKAGTAYGEFTEHTEDTEKE